MQRKTKDIEKVPPRKNLGPVVMDLSHDSPVFTLLEKAQIVRNVFLINKTKDEKENGVPPFTPSHVQKGSEDSALDVSVYPSSQPLPSTPIDPSVLEEYTRHRPNGSEMDEEVDFSPSQIDEDRGDKLVPPVVVDLTVSDPKSTVPYHSAGREGWYQSYNSKI